LHRAEVEREPGAQGVGPQHAVAIACISFRRGREQADVREIHRPSGQEEAKAPNDLASSACRSHRRIVRDRLYAYRFTGVPYTSIRATFTYPPAPCPLPGIRSAKPT